MPTPNQSSPPLRRSRTPLAALLVGLATLASGGAVAEGVKLPAKPAAELVKAMQGGGHVIFIRHTVTDKEGADQISAVMGDCSTQRTLSAQGWADARAIGAAFQALRIPVGEVLSSQYCRAWQTAEIAFGRAVQTPALNFEKAEKYTDAQTEAMKKRVVPLLAKAPSAGFNTVIVGHDDPFEAATGHYPEPQGKLVVLKPDGKGGFTLVGGVNPDQWWGIIAANARRS
jgi:phosphohistidine phosphatase SixA